MVLASASPRRAELLRAAGFNFDVVPADIDERPLPGERPDEYVRRVAAGKAQTVADLRPDAVVIGADTVVVVDGRMLGKPENDEDAARMLCLLSGRTHHVLTGVAARHGSQACVEFESSRVRVGVLSPTDIAWYVSSGEPRDKAGAYAIQGLASRFIEAIDGSYSNVVGLPVALLCRLLRQLGVHEAGPERSGN